MCVFPFVGSYYTRLRACACSDMVRKIVEQVVFATEKGHALDVRFAARGGGQRLARALVRALGL